MTLNVDSDYLLETLERLAAILAETAVDVCGSA
jgi:hypothetical protein